MAMMNSRQVYKEDDDFVFLDVVLPSAPAIQVPYARKVDEEEEDEIEDDEFEQLEKDDGDMTMRRRTHHRTTNRNNVCRGVMRSNDDTDNVDITTTGTGGEMVERNESSSSGRRGGGRRSSGDSQCPDDLLAHINQGRPVIIIPNHFDESSSTSLTTGGQLQETVTEQLRQLQRWRGGGGGVSERRGSVAYYSLSNTNTTVMVPMVTPVNPDEWKRESPMECVCPFCFQEVLTVVKRDAYSAVPVAVGLAAIGLWPVAVIPLCVQSLHDVKHSCPACQADLARIRCSFKDYVNHAKKCAWFCYEGCQTIKKKVYDARNPPSTPTSPPASARHRLAAEEYLY